MESSKMREKGGRYKWKRREPKPDQVRSPRIIFIDSEPAASLQGINFQFQRETEKTKQGKRKETR